MDIWNILEIKPTKDKKEIKKAYAKLAAKYHPEDYPEEFQIIKDAYQQALSLANGKQQPENALPYPDTSQTEIPEVFSLDFANPESSDSPQIGIHFDEIIESGEQEYETQHRKDLDHAFAQLYVFAGKRGLQSHNKWVDYLQSNAFKKVMEDPEFLNTFLPTVLKLNFWPKTVISIEQTFKDRESLTKQQINHPRLQQYLSGENRKVNIKKTWIPAAKLLITCLVLLCFIPVTVNYIKNIQEQQRAKEHFEAVRDVENIENYLLDEFNFNCKVEKKFSSMQWAVSNLPTSDDYDYFRAEIINSTDGITTFTLAWEKSSDDTSEIMDDLDFHTLTQYAEANDIYVYTFGTQGNKPVLLYESDSYETFLTNVSSFLEAIMQSAYITSGHKLIISVQNSEFSFTSTDFILSKDEPLDMETLQAKIEKTEEEQNALKNNTNFVPYYNPE